MLILQIQEKQKGKLIKTLLTLVKSPTVPRSVNEFWKHLSYFGVIFLASLHHVDSKRKFSGNAWAQPRRK